MEQDECKVFRLKNKIKMLLIYKGVISICKLYKIYRDMCLEGCCVYFLSGT